MSWLSSGKIGGGFIGRNVNPNPGGSEALGLWRDFTGQTGIEQQNAANISMAREQMAFQERMSNSAHQREVKDMVAAGINPILSAGGSGASSPGGASATLASTKSGVQGAVMSLLSFALSAMKNKAEIKNINASTAKTLSEAEAAKLMPQLIGRQIAKEGFSAKGLELDMARKQVMNGLWKSIQEGQSPIEDYASGKIEAKGLNQVIMWLYKMLKSDGSPAGNLRFGAGDSDY